MNTKILFYLPEGFADWEGAFLMPELAESKREFITVTEHGKSITSIGRLKVQPDAALSDISADDIRALVLIGSDTWTDPAKNKNALSVARKVLNGGNILGSLCASTIAITREGLRTGRKHTNNSLQSLKHFIPGYSDEKNYEAKLAVRDGNLITAPGVGAIEFTLEMLRALDVYSEPKRQQWFELYKNGTQPPDEFWS